MIITKISEPFPETVFRQSHVRSGGVHLSEVIRDMEETLWPGKYEGTRGWDLNSCAQVGVFWEVVLSWAYRDTFATDIGEVELDGIVGTPDGVSSDDEGVYLEEYKASWKSSKNQPTDIFHYRMQGMGYCKMLGLDRIVFRILHVMGDYAGSGPVYNVWDIRWDQKEIDEAWESLVNHARYRGWL